MIILGIDPGLETTGFGIIVSERKRFEAKDFGVFKTSMTSSFSERLHSIAMDIEEILDLWKPDILAIEQLIFAKNVTNGLLVAHARGVILEKAVRRGILIKEFLPTEIKSRITGNGKAPKEQVGKMVQKILGLPEIPKPDDAADALAIALSAGESSFL